MSLLLYAHFLQSADIFGATPLGGYRGDLYQLTAAWSELTMAVILAQVCLLQMAAVFAALLDQNGNVPGSTGSVSRITAGIGIAVVAGPAIALLMAFTAHAYFTAPSSLFAPWTLRWSIWPVLPVAISAALVAVAAWRRRFTPTDGWDAFLAFPASSLTTTTLGIVTLAVVSVYRLPYWLAPWHTGLVYAGGLLIAVGIACALVRNLIIRVAVALPLAISLMILAQGPYGRRMLGAFYAAAVAVWWLKRLWALLATPR
ncbi:hypothetical protein [Actinoplanes awajinensis]|uniref:Uncharacterized protein n=1 Tax=Actinoplanes awajinensis subsp. mycoplanecinus TaxID=135947 RepID=A0A124GA86_9ACTN|nr:hypothetical protein [Actinoplanes awajinensis]KUL31435.1 hypothetical protein ADL15_22125 [Actinoplanes awajinensis subsp. mycoplanecinus]